MPTFSRQSLRRTLGQAHLRDMTVGVTTGTSTAPPHVIDAFLANTEMSGRGLYRDAWIRLGASLFDFRVASFNVASGALVSVQNLGGGVPSVGFPYELHEMLPPADKDRALDDAVKRLRVRREVTVASVDGLTSYSLPPEVEQVLGGYAFASPAGSLDRGRFALRSVDVALTATGTEVRITPALGASQQLVLDAITTVTLGAPDTATVTIPDERLVLYAAEAACWDLMVRKAPRGTSDEYRRLRDEAARQYADLAKRFKVPVDRPLRLDGEAV